MQAIDFASAENLALERSALLSYEMWQAPRILWTQWCNIMIDAWVCLLSAPPILDVYRDPETMPTMASSIDREG